MNLRLWCVVFAVGSCVYSIDTRAAQSETTIEATLAVYDRDFDNPDSDRVQSGAGLIARHERVFFSKLLTIGLAAYGAQKLHASGRITEDLLPVNNGSVDSFSLLGEAYLRLQLSDKLELTIGRSQHKSLLLKSKTRLLPSTFQGLSAQWSPSARWTLYAHQFSRWSRRADDAFERFQTNVSSPGAIDNLSIGGIKYAAELDHQNQLNVQAEILESKNYLRKFGVVSTVSKSLEQQSTLAVTLGLFGSADAGNLFVNGANDGLDTQQQANGERLDHRGLGGYLRASLSRSNHQVELTHSRFGDPWLEDNFADDHGTTPFPSKTYGPELTNKNESIWMLGYQYRHTHSLLRGLTSRISAASGKHAENSLNREFGLANESWVELDLKYQPAFSKYASARVRYRAYNSEELGSVAGVGGDREELRINIDYIRSF